MRFGEILTRVASRTNTVVHPLPGSLLQVSSVRLSKQFITERERERERAGWVREPGASQPDTCWQPPEFPDLSPEFPDLWDLRVEATALLNKTEESK